MTEMFGSKQMGARHIEYRVENKCIVSDLEIAAISQRLKMVMESDIHQQGEFYEIRSIYFDDAFDGCMDENDAGVDCRKKYRIRTYGSAAETINLEIKEKRSGLTRKRACSLTREEHDEIIDDGQSVEFGAKPVKNELLLQMRCADMKPKVIVAYERTAFVHPSGNVRITFDRNIMGSREIESFFDEHIAGLVPVMPAGYHVLEVKYDEMLPDVIARQLEIGKLRQTAFSKYYLARLAVSGEFPMIG